MVLVLEKDELEVVPTFTSEEIRNRLSILDLTDQTEVEQFTLDFVSSLCAFDTQTFFGGEFHEAMNYILDVMRDQIERANLKVEKFRCYDDCRPIPRQSCIITSCVNAAALNNLKLQYLAKQSNKESVITRFCNSTVHCHLDSAGHYSGRSTLKTFVNQVENLAYAKAIVDMKASIVSAVLLVEMFIREGYEEIPTIVFRCDEELAGIYGGLDLMRLMQIEGIVLDLECNPSNTAFTNEIKPKVEVSVAGYKPDKGVLDGLQKVLNMSFPKDFLPTINIWGGDITVSLATEDTSRIKRLVVILLELGIIKKPEEAKQHIIQGAKSKLSKPNLNEINQIMQGNYPFEERQISRYSAGSMNILQSGFSNIGYIFNNFATMVTLAYGDNVNWGLIGPMEKGNGRHTEEEGLDISHPFFVAKTTKEIIKRKLPMNLDEM